LAAIPLATVLHYAWFYAGGLAGKKVVGFSWIRLDLPGLNNLGTRQVARRHMPTPPFSYPYFKDQINRRKHSGGFGNVNTDSREFFLAKRFDQKLSICKPCG